MFGLRSARGDAYATSGRQGTYEDAVAYCESIGFALAEIPSAEDNERARVACGGSSCWIALVEVGGDRSTSAANQVWAWSDGGVASYRNWADGEPGNFGGRDERNAIMNCCGDGAVGVSDSPPLGASRVPGAACTAPSIAIDILNLSSGGVSRSTSGNIFASTIASAASHKAPFE